MQITSKEVVVGMMVKSDGIEFEIRDANKKHWGALVLTMTGLTWCKGRRTRANGDHVSWEDFIEWMERDHRARDTLNTEASD